MTNSFYATRSSKFTCVDHYWHMTESFDGQYPQYATAKWGFVFSRYHDQYQAKLIGPQLTPHMIPFRKTEYFWGIVFQGYANLSIATKRELLNQNLLLDISPTNHFTLGKHHFQIPTYDALDTFIEQLINKKLISTTPLTPASVRTSQRQFKKFTGLTPKQIQQASRVDHALTLLGTDLNLTQIALECGFSDQAHMSRELKRLVGLTPTQARKLFAATI